MNKYRRTTFQKYRYIIGFSCYLTSLLPRFIKNFLWSSSSIYSGKLALLIRFSILKSLTKECGVNVYIGSYVTIKSFKSITLGSNISIHTGCYIDGTGGIDISNDVSIAHHSSILSTNHSWDDKDIPIKYNKILYNSVTIHNDVWIGCGVRVMSGVTINSRSVVAAASVVTRDVASNTLVAGIPATMLKRINQ